MRKNLLYFLIFFLLLGIILFAFYRFAYSSLDKYNDTRLNPLNMSSVKIDSSNTYNYVFLGDSHCQYWKTDRQNVLNLGYTGQTSEQIKIKTQLLEDRLKGENIVLSIGANDVKSVATNPETKEQIVNNCVENINKILEIIKPKFQNVYIITIPPDFDAGWKQKIFNYQKTLEAKKEINEKIRELSKSKGLILIDTEKIFEKEGDFSDDGVHMNQNAYKILNGYLK